MDKLINKQLTRKQFLTTIGSIAGLFVMSKITKLSSLSKKSLSSLSKANTYGNYSYGGSKQNA